MQLTKFSRAKGCWSPRRPQSASSSSLKNPPQPCIISFYFWAKLGLHSNNKMGYFGAYTASCWPHETFIENFIFREKSQKMFQMNTQKIYLSFNHQSGVQVSFNLKTKNLKLNKTFDFPVLKFFLPSSCNSASCLLPYWSMIKIAVSDTHILIIIEVNGGLTIWATKRI